MLKETLRKYFLPALLVVAIIISLYHPSSDNLNDIANRIQNKLSKSETLFQSSIANPSLTAALSAGDIQSKIISDLTRSDILLYYYRHDSLLTWTDNHVVPPATLSELPEGTSLQKLKNGWYEVLKASHPDKEEVLLGLVPVKYAYPFENRFLKNDFSSGFSVPENIELSDKKIAGAISVNNKEGEMLFCLYVSGEGAAENLNLSLLIAQLIVLLLIFFYLQQFTGILKNRYGFPKAFLFLFLTMLLIRGAMLWLNVPTEMNKLDLFNPKNYASSSVTKSLGDLIINIGLIVWLVFYYEANRPLKKSKQLRFPLVFLWIAGVYLFSGIVAWVFKTLVMDSVISFEVYNILSLNFYSILGLTAFAFLLITHFVISRAVVVKLIAANISLKPILAISGICTLLFSLFAIDSPFYHVILFTAGWLFLLLPFMFLMLQNDSSLSVRNIILYVFAYGLLTTFLIENLYERKERNQRVFFATKLGAERDYVAEYMFNDIAKRISKDVFIRNYLTNPIISKKQIFDRLNALYLSGYFNKYDLQIFAFDSYGHSIKAEDSVATAQVKEFLNLKDAPSLHYVADTTQNYAYISTINFSDDSTNYGALIMKLTPKVYYGQNVYPELLVGSNVTLSNNIYNYDYAIYQNNRLVAQYGDFPYTYQWNKEYKFGDEVHEFIEEPDWEHGIMRFPNGKRVIVSVHREPLFEPVATFSYLFAFFFTLAVSLLIVAGLLKKDIYGEDFLNSLTLSFRTRINYSMLAMIVFSFLIIGVITINFFRTQYDHFYNDRLMRKEKVVHASLEYYIQQNRVLLNNDWGDNLDVEIARLAEINSVDVNLYDTNGDLVEASQPSIYDKGIISKKMDPTAYFHLIKSKSARITNQENIGGLNYMATYSPVRNLSGNTVAFLGIPYFERSKDINDEVSGFLVALMNVYVFLLICAAILAYFISNSITRPLTIISEKLRILNLNKKNEPIEWNSRDEIGVLIGEYNKMIAELERSAHKLAKSERESAWREMAKQIAHEIKNPLTPMKLSIQYLQKAIDAGNPNIEQLAKKVAKTLEEQIENLSSIATAFASFAKMPRPENELINLNEFLKSIAELFNKEDGITITFTSDCNAAFVFADKNQFVSVFNNLVKNAIQSIPENRTGFIDIHVKEEDELLLVTVSDNGSGIPKENYEAVFVPNFTTKSSGTGLGLAISKRIIEGAGGKIWFESAENVGTTFYVRLKKEQ